MKRQPICEIELVVPCGEEDTHPVRVGIVGWGKFEVVWTPCDDWLGPFGLMAPCRDWVREQLPEKFRRDWKWRFQLVGSLEQVGVSAVPVLIEALKDSDEDVRRASAEALGKIQDPQAVPALIQTLKDSDKDVRQASAEALGKIGDSQAVPALIQTLKDSEWDVRRASAEALVQIGKPAVPTLIQTLKDSSEDVRRLSAEALGKIQDPQAVPYLSLFQSDSHFRQALQQMNAEPLPLSQAVPFVARQQHWAVLMRALPYEGVVEAVSQLGSEAVPMLINALKDSDKDVRRLSAEALGKIQDSQAVPALIQTLKDSYWLVRSASMCALVKIGKSAVPALIETLKDSDWRVRKASAEALRRIGDSQALPALQQALQQEQNKHVRSEIQKAISEIQRRNKR